MDPTLPPAMPSALTILVAGALVALTLAAAAFALLWRRERRRRARLRDQADEAARSADAFFDLVTHEIRSPLAAILGYHELLRDGAYGPTPHQADEPIDRIGRSARHLLDLIEGLVEVGRLRAGTVNPHLEPVDLRIIAIEIAEALRTHARDRNIDVTSHVDPELPTIQSDQERLVRALDLLAVSAAKHPGDHGLELHVRRHDDGASFRIHGARIPTRQADDAAVRFGLRIAAAQGIARILGDELVLERVRDQDEEYVVAAEMRVRGAPSGER